MDLLEDLKATIRKAIEIMDMLEEDGNEAYDLTVQDVLCKYEQKIEPLN